MESGGSGCKLDGDDRLRCSFQADWFCTDRFHGRAGKRTSAISSEVRSRLFAGDSFAMLHQPVGP